MRMPAIFVGHGSPMNGIEHNSNTEAWSKLGEQFTPKGIVMISGHWLTKGLRVQGQAFPKKINDMYGFPDALYAVDYKVKGSQMLTNELQRRLGNGVKVDNGWGIDHGTWSVLVHMYPLANIPVVQLSVDGSASPERQFEIGQSLRGLRDLGYMIMASGNVVHNLSQMTQGLTHGEPFAIEFDDYIEKSILERAYERCVNYLNCGPSAGLSVPTPEHFYPLLTLLGAVSEEDDIRVFNKGYDFGSISMTSYLFN